MSDASEDRFLGGRVLVRQPADGFRSGLDAVMLAAAVPGMAGESVLELGAGAGAASLCLAARVPGLAVTGVEIDDLLAALAGSNAAANSLESRVHFAAGDALSLPRALRREFDHVFSNPPFHDEAGEVSPHAGRARARQGKVGDWIAAGFRRVRSGGTFTAIVRADRLAEVLAALPQGGVTVFPLWPRADVPAKRIVVQVRKGSGARLSLRPGLVLHDGTGAFTPAAEAILRCGASLALARPRL